MSFWSEIECRRARWNVLEHPFYRRWSAGDLTHHELKIYASEYAHAVIAIATASRRAAELGGDTLCRHAEEEDQHVQLWHSFAKQAGWGGFGGWAYAEEPLPETEECARVWSGEDGRPLARHLMSLYSIELTQAEVSQIKLDGLLRHYRFEQGPGTEYFSVHARTDAHHAALMRETLGVGSVDSDREWLLDQAEAVGRSYWLLLDGVESFARRSCPSF